MRRGYAFSGTWKVDAPMSTVQEVLVDVEHYPEWWPQVRAVASLGADDARVLCRSVLPYTLDLHVHAVRRGPSRLEVAIAGDLDGMASWRLTDLGRRTRLDFAQEVTVGGWLAALSPVVRPILRWNHARMMAGCMEGLRDRVVSRRA
ncbi:MAG TPA: SRPBCC family protein [Nocardioides sp.]|nr:SRPBCC family protein [Nocardioides sp.]